jgi:hypothetical protein
LSALAVPVANQTWPVGSTENSGHRTEASAGHARHTKPRPAMHGLRFSNEVDGD